jgi:hypothetical protein
MSHLVTSPIVGARFRPPAAGLLSVLPAAARLLVRREPDNQYDPNALQVLVTRETLAQLPEQQLQAACEGFGFGASEVLAAAEWHLGYVPRGEAEKFAPRFDSEGLREAPGSLTFDLQGRPAVSFEIT